MGGTNYLDRNTFDGVTFVKSTANYLTKMIQFQIITVLGK